MNATPEIVSPVDPSDPYEREPQTCPRPSREQIGCAKAFDARENAPAGGLLFGRGQRNSDNFILIEGEILSGRGDGQNETLESGNIFVMIGAAPKTGWRDGCLALDKNGFIPSDAEAGGPASSKDATSNAGIFAVGDVRAGSATRVASAAGERSVVAAGIPRFLEARRG